MLIPVFDLQGGAALAAARGAAVTALLSAFGTIVFRFFVLPRTSAHMPADIAGRIRQRLLLLTQAGVAAAILGYGVWLVAQAADMADAGSLAASFAALPAVIATTLFGHVIVLQLATLAALAVAVGWRAQAGRQPAALLLASLAVALQAGHSHAWSMEPGPSLLLACDILHLAAAGAWLGGLAPLLLVVRSAPPKAAALAARWFSPLGQACVAALVVSAAIQGWVLVGSIPGLIGTAYGWMVLAKLALFAILLGFAWLNRYRFAPALLRANPQQGRRSLARSITLQTGFALAVIGAAIVLSELPPAMHVQALWPFSQRFSLDAIDEDPDFRREVLQAGLVLAIAAGMVTVTLLIRRFRMAAGAAAMIAAWFAVPHLDLLLVTAYPTSFYHSPTGFASAGIVDGSRHFAQNCAGCHGAEGAGNGVLAKTLPVPPADLTADHLWMHSDGELFWWISHGMATPEGAQAMPGFAGRLDEDARWALIDYVRAHNAGTANRLAGGWPHPVQAPGFGAQCGQRMLQLHDLRGRFVRLVIGAVPPPDAMDDGVVTIVAAPAADDAAPAACVTLDGTVPAAYAIVSGVAPGAMAGMQFLIDANGWLRAMQKPAAPASWNEPAALMAEIANLRAHRMAAVAAPMKMPM